MGAKKEYLNSAWQQGIKFGKDKESSVSDAVRATTSMLSSEIAKEKDLNKAKQARKALVAQRLSAMRDETGDKQKTVADAIGVNVMTLSGYETGKSEPNFETIVRLADYYKVSLDYLICRTDTRIKFDPNEYTAKDEDRQQKLNRIQELEKAVAEIKKDLE